MQGYIVGMTVPYMPDDKQAVVRARIGLFELRALRRDKENELVCGPFDVVVRETVDARGTAVPSIKWITGNEGMTEYRVDKKGNLLAWMPDDPWWHNRVFLLDNEWMNPVNLHTHLGIIAGQDMLEHLAVLSRELKCEKEIIDVYVNGVLKFSSPDQERADIEIDKKKRIYTTVKEGKIELQKERDVVYTTKPRKVLDYKPEIKDLIQRARRERLQYGWTSCPEFINEIKPKVIKEIEASGLQPVALGQVSSRDIINGIAKMTLAERRALAEALAVPPAAIENEPHAITESTAPEPARVKHAGGRPRKTRVDVEG